MSNPLVLGMVCRGWWWADLHIRDPAWLMPIKGCSATPARTAPISMLVRSAERRATASCARDQIRRPGREPCGAKRDERAASRDIRRPGRVQRGAKADNVPPTATLVAL